jgi:hypothetical protein
MKTTKLEAALLYAKWGWPVFPLIPNGKLPATAHGFKDATTDQKIIQDWWRVNPNQNIGVVCGKESGLIIFDIDPRNGGEDSWDKWLQENGPLPDGAGQLTAGGGWHHLAQWQEEIKSCKLMEGIDLLSDGRYFVACPSDIVGKSYIWEGSSDPTEGAKPFILPEKWIESIKAKKKTVSTGLSGELIRGNRNSGITSLAGSMRRIGMNEPEILVAMSMVNETRCEIPLPFSEIKQIVKSVCGYKIGIDIALTSATGTEAAETLCAKTEDYYFVRATCFLSQPHPIPWIIKGWLPQYATVMIYGDSGVGKTFVALDMACCIATGKSWSNLKTKSGVVVYLVGEGTTGFGQRIASWSKKHNIGAIDNLLISNRAIDLDGPESTMQIIAAIRALTKEDIMAIVVDTVNCHMAGDENTAKDTSSMIRACNFISSAFKATTILIHHSGILDKRRARGSSAWKGALDSQILVSSPSEPGSKDKEIVIENKKMKDGLESSNQYGKLELVDLGWLDEDGENQPGAVFVYAESPIVEEQEAKSTKLQEQIKTFKNAWASSTKEIREDMPYLSRDILRDYLIKVCGITHGTACSYTNPNKEGRLIYNLLLSQTIRSHEEGWVICDQVIASSMVLSVEVK